MTGQIRKWLREESENLKKWFIFGILLEIPFGILNFCVFDDSAQAWVMIVGSFFCWCMLPYVGFAISDMSKDISSALRDHYTDEEEVK